MRKPRNYDAILSIYDFPSFDKKHKKAVVKWLRKVTDDLEKDSLLKESQLANRFHARLLK